MLCFKFWGFVRYYRSWYVCNYTLALCQNFNPFTCDNTSGYGIVQYDNRVMISEIVILRPRSTTFLSFDKAYLM